MLKLVIANKLYSSWSLRPWALLKAFEIPFEEVTIPLRRPDSRERLMEYSPSGKVPVLVDDDVFVWESMAIVETIAERNPDRAIWPRDAKARAHAPPGMPDASRGAVRDARADGLAAGEHRSH